MDIIQSITGVFDKLTQWLVGTITSFESVFYNSESGLTLIGTLTLVSVGIGVGFLLFNVIRRFFDRV